MTGWTEGARLLALTAALLGATVAAAQTALPFGVGEHEPDQPVEITSDSLSVDQGANTATFRGSVVVGQGALRLAAEEVLVQYEEGPAGGTVVEFIRALGGVTVTNGAEAAESEEALYSVAPGTVEMTGAVVVTTGPNAVSGDRLVIDLAAGTANVEGRVQTVVIPGTLRQEPGQ